MCMLWVNGRRLAPTCPDMSEYMSLIYASDLWVNERSRVVDAARCIVSHACDAIASPFVASCVNAYNAVALHIASSTRRGAWSVMRAMQSRRLSHSWRRATQEQSCAYRIVGVATDVSIVALLYDIPKYRPSVLRLMGGDSRQHAQTCWCRCGILSRPTSTCSRRRLAIAFSDLDQYVAVSDLSRHVGIDGVFFPIPKSSVVLR